MSNILENNIVEILNEDGWNLISHEKEGLYATSFEGKNGIYKVYLNVRNLHNQLLITYGYIPIKSPQQKRASMALLLNKINRELYFGNFEMDYSNGEIVFRNGMHFLGEEFTKYMAVNTISPCAFTVDKYFPAIKSMLDTRISPEDALKRVEG